MTEIGTVIDGKYEILTEIGRGGMSIVYLAMDKRLNKQWAVKEINKVGNGRNDEVIVNSLLAEANMMKRLDHPSLPRIVDIIDDGITIYVVMDYIEGESLDKILLEYGAQSEELVIGWAKQLCEALSYLHSQRPPIVYRDMKPANIMLKPEGNIKIIDFGIAREYKEQNLADTTVLGTKGYAPPEQYSGQTDPRSDIFALGMTMHHLLTGVDPRGGEPYAPVRQWNPELSEGIEIIIDKCVQPASENRYQSCADLLYDLEHPELITSGFKKKQKSKLYTFVATAVMSVVMLIAGIGFSLAATSMNNHDYDINVSGNDPAAYYTAVEIYPERTEAYEKLIEYCNSLDAQSGSKDAIAKLCNTVNKYKDSLDISNPVVADLYYDLGKLYFSKSDESFRARAIGAKEFFRIASESPAEFDKKEIAGCYLSICKFMTNQSEISEPALSDYEALFAEIDSAMSVVDKATDNERNYDKISLYYVTSLLINSQAEYMAGVGFDRQTVLNMLENIHKEANSLGSSLASVNDLVSKINDNYDSFVLNINVKYDEFEKRKSSN